MWHLPFVLTLLNLSGDDPSSALKVGDAAPRLGVREMLQAPKEAKTDWSDLKGHVVVLEFWATWCGPCIEAIPHINELAARFRDKPVRFISLTDEDSVLIRKFVDKTPMRTWVGLTDEDTLKTFGVHARPVTVVVDKGGRVAAVTTPNNLTPELIEAVLAGRVNTLAQPITRVEIRPFLGTSGRREYEPIEGGFEARNSTVQELISIAWRVPTTRIDARTPLPDRTFDVVVSVTGGDRSAARLLLRTAIEASFGWRVSEEQRETEVLVLRKAVGKEPTLRPAEATDQVQTSADRFLATQRTLKMFANDLEGMLSRPVVDETLLDGSYRLELHCKRGDFDSIVAAVRNDLGFELTKQVRLMPYLIVQPINAAKR